MSFGAKLRLAYPYKAPSTSVDHLVIGGGVIGLAVAAAIVKVAGANRTTFVIERRGQLGQETTARNSEVIHSGIYYPVDSLKSRLCIRGRDLLYARCQALGIGHRKTQKLIVATKASQIPFLDKLQTLSLDPRLRSGTAELSATQSDSIVPAYFLSGYDAREMEPDLGESIKAALLVTETGIVDSQGLVDSLEREIQGDLEIPSTSKGAPERGEGVIVKGTRVVRIDPGSKGGWDVQLETGWKENHSNLGEDKGDVECVHADVVVNAAGLFGATLQEGVVPAHEQVKIYPVKGDSGPNMPSPGSDRGLWANTIGNYMSYKGPGVSQISRLIYPCPSGNIDHLGTHLTLDLNGKIKFGPDVEPIGTSSSSLENPDFWQEHLAPSESRIQQIAEAVQDYLPNIDPEGLSPDYSGIRPNIAPSNAGFSDFLVRHSPDRKGLIELLGFNSPGLTSSLAVGELVAGLVRRDIYHLESGLEGLARGWE